MKLRTRGNANRRSNNGEKKSVTTVKKKRFKDRQQGFVEVY